MSHSSFKQGKSPLSGKCYILFFILFSQEQRQQDFFKDHLCLLFKTCLVYVWYNLFWQAENKLRFESKLDFKKLYFRELTGLISFLSHVNRQHVYVTRVS